jgi:hypothetical protein
MSIRRDRSVEFPHRHTVRVDMKTGSLVAKHISVTLGQLQKEKAFFFYPLLSRESGSVRNRHCEAQRQLNYRIRRTGECVAFLATKNIIIL